MRATIIHNAVAGKAKRKQLQFEAALRRLESAGWTLDVVETSREGHGTDLASAAVKSGADIVVAAGGDGTVNELIQALAHTEVALGVLPMGTVNVWSKEAGYASDVVQAADQVARGTRTRIDLGRAGGRYFLLMAGVGLDAEVASTLGQGKSRKQKLGTLPYVMRTMQVIPRYRGATIEIELDGRSGHHDVLMVLASNTRLYGGVARPAPEAVANDGMLDIRLFHGSGPLHSLRHIVNLLMASRVSIKETDVIRAREIKVDATPPLAVQVDGDPIGMTPIEISVQPKALWAILPPDFQSTLIQSLYD